MTRHAQTEVSAMPAGAIPLADLRGCPDCGQYSVLPELRAGVDAFCDRCGKSFSRPRARSMDHALSYAALGLVFLLLAISAPFLSVNLYGRYQTSMMWSGAGVLGQAFDPLGLLVLTTIILMPMTKLGLTVFVLGSLRYERPSRLVVPAFRWIKHISPWAMMEVFLLGFLVAYTRLQNLATVHMDLAVYAMIACVLAMAATDQALDRESVWKEIQSRFPQAPAQSGPLLSCRVCHQANRGAEGMQCSRCGSVIHHRKIDSVSRCWAFIIAALVFYVPANAFPVMTITQLGSASAHTIIGGMIEFWHEGMWPLALLIFLASIAIPAFKLVGLGYMLISAQYRSGLHLTEKTRLYRAIDFIGRWSMVDIFMVAILVSLMQFGQLVSVSPGLAAPCFTMVVILTMMAAESFDPRLLWDCADMRARAASSPAQESIIP